MIDTYNRECNFSTLKNYCHLSADNDYIEVIRWKNNEGFDVDVYCETGNQRFSLTYGQFELLNVLVNYRGEVKNG